MSFLRCFVNVYRCKRTKKHGYKPLRSKPPLPPPPPPPQPPPPPPVFTKTTKPKNTSANERGLWPPTSAGAKKHNWNTMPTSCDRKQAEIANNIFINELMNAFRNFNVLETMENSRGKISDKIPQRNIRGKTIPPEKSPQTQRNTTETAPQIIQHNIQGNSTQRAPLTQPNNRANSSGKTSQTHNP